MHNEPVDVRPSLYIFCYPRCHVLLPRLDRRALLQLVESHVFFLEHGKFAESKTTVSCVVLAAFWVRKATEGPYQWQSASGFDELPLKRQLGLVV